MQSSSLESNRVAGTRLELLLFKLQTKVRYGINVFKVQEIISKQKLTRVVGAHPYVLGIATLRGNTMPIIDLSAALGGPSIDEPANAPIIITEYNRSTHGFLVNAVDSIAHTQWDDVRAPPDGMGTGHFITAVCIMDGELIEILDVEKVLDQVVHASTEVSDSITESSNIGSRRVLVVDDSLVARNQVERALAGLGVECMLTKNGLEALKLVDDLRADGHDLSTYIDMVISDIEMPTMDGYTLIKKLRAQAEFRDTFMLLHSSISGEFNWGMVKEAGANQFMQKYSADDLAQAVLDQFSLE